MMQFGGKGLRLYNSICLLFQGELTDVYVRYTVCDEIWMHVLMNS